MKWQHNRLIARHPVSAIAGRASHFFGAAYSMASALPRVYCLLVTQKVCPKCGTPQQWILWRHCDCGYDFGPPSPEDLPKKPLSLPLRKPSWFEVVPWILLFVVLIAYWTGLGPQIASTIPYGFGSLAWKNSFCGVGILFLICAALRYLKLPNEKDREECFLMATLGAWLISLSVGSGIP